MTNDGLPGLELYGLDDDPPREAVADALRRADPDGRRAAAVFRATFDQLYDGQHTGRFRWDQLFKTEKTHYGTLLEINLRREFDGVIDDGERLDFQILGVEIDCKYSQSMGGWMLPPECFGELLLVAYANDSASTWSLGVVRASVQNLRSSRNRDGKTSLNPRGRSQIAWLHLGASLPPNVLLSLDEATLAAILRPRSGQARVNELLRRVTLRRIGRNTIATLAQQDDYMARIRDNGHGARTILRDEGFIIPGGDYQVHRDVAAQLGVTPPQPGEVVSIPVVPADPGEPHTVVLENRNWRVARNGERMSEAAPRLPDTRKRRSMG
ncbi:NaeI family type II restriction endonuclease [Jiangella rhizosphaerae]|uniref:Restriction endonuclease n=1 Tax=Jiangella rhizosphaerae TaxID=2293569 RepID=A0A418KM65_9ACTN|nr:NaeI family type II restriction endonuclease [Jiangella rhizosphaerae]RIQ19465.1 restriction endonuclease [Jiangella rhizosphaerae]